MKFYYLIILISLSPTLTFANTITLSRGKDSVLQNFSELILRKAYQEIGVELKIIQVPLARSLVLANNGVLDGDISRISEIERNYDNLIKIPVPINHIDIRMFTYNRKILVNPKEKSSFYRVGCVRGIFLVEQMITKQKTHCHTVTNYDQAINMLNKNRIDVLILPLAIGDYFKDIDPQFSTSHYGDSLSNEPLFHYLHKKHHALVPKLTSILKRMKIDIYKKSYISPLGFLAKINLL